MFNIASVEEQKKIVAKAKYYLDLLGDDLNDRNNISAIVMAIAWRMGQKNKENGFQDSVESGYKVAITANFIQQMLGSGIILSMKADTLEEAYLTDDADDEEEAA